MVNVITLNSKVNQKKNKRLEYYIEVYRRSNQPSEEDFWSLHREYNGSGFSDSGKDHELLGKFHRVFIKPDNPVTLEELRKNLPNLTIISLEKQKAS